MWCILIQLGWCSLLAGCDRLTQPIPLSAPSAPCADSIFSERKHVQTDAAEAPLDQIAGSLLSAEEQKFLEWLDSVEVPDLKNRTFVRVVTPAIVAGPIKSTFQHLTRPDGSSITRGFVLESNGNRFRIFTTHLRTRLFAKTPRQTPLFRRVTIEKVNLKDEATARLVELRRPLRDGALWQQYERIRVTTRVELVALARGCAAHGQTQLSHQLIAQAASMSHGGMDGLSRDLRSYVEEMHLQRHVLALCDPSEGRSDLAKAFRRFAAMFPKSRYAHRAKATARVLAQMANEDEEHNPNPIDQMTVKERVAELIFQLRDQQNRSQDWSRPEDIFTGTRDDPLGLEHKTRNRGSPATELVRIGDAALEQLIDSVDDNRLTRSILHDKKPSHWVLTIGECCVLIIDEIRPSGRRFDIEDNPELAKRAMKAWYLGKNRQN